MAIKSTPDTVLELPPLAKRPRDILEGSYQRDILATIRGFSMNSSKSQPQSMDLTNMDANQEPKRMRTDIWRAAGKELQDLPFAGESEITSRAAGCHDKAIMTWEMNTKAGPRVPTDMDTKSPYVTEAGNPLFEAFYQR